MRWLFAIAVCGATLTGGLNLIRAGEKEATPHPSRVLPAGQVPEDARLGKYRGIYDAYHPWTPPATKEAWEAERERIRTQVLVSNGLWPLWPKTELNAVVHTPIDQGDYVVEHVYFESLPGHYVTGNLYRPKEVKGKVPGILCPHGHWANGRFYLTDDKASQEQINIKAEEFESGARSPLQARMVSLARMGCIVFHYDMVGYADSNKLGHRDSLLDLHSLQWLQTFMGLQTWNSIRALDFLTSLPDVDPERIGVTGASGGGTQTFLLAAVDPRVSVAFPAVMVSTGMQGGCVCENAPYLRIGINNIALAAVFAPKPQAMSGADDWTIEIETKGYPELQHIYALYGKRENVLAKAFPQFKHNYNQPARELMAEWMNTHLKLGLTAPVQEKAFELIPAKELSVWNDQHPQPENSNNLEQFKAALTKIEQQQLESWQPKSKEDVEAYRKIIGPAAEVMLDRLPDDIKLTLVTQSKLKAGETEVQLGKGFFSRGETEKIPALSLQPKDFNGQVVLWVDGAGKSSLFTEAGELTAEVQQLLQAGRGVVSVDVLYTGEYLAGKEPAKPGELDKNYPGMTIGYNKPLIANRVRDILTAVHFCRQPNEFRGLTLVGTGEAGPWVLLAAALAGDRVHRTVVNLDGFSFESIKDANDPNFLPGALKYGDIGGLAALAAPQPVTIAGTEKTPGAALQPLRNVYGALEASEQLILQPGSLAPAEIVTILLK